MGGMYCCTTTVYPYSVQYILPYPYSTYGYEYWRQYEHYFGTVGAR